MSSPDTTSLRARRMALVGLFANIFLAMIKLVAGIVGHSGALIADAIESMADVGGSLVIWGGVRYGAVPADHEHPYGHGKAEALASLIVSCLLGVAAIGIAVQAVHDLRTPHPVPAPFTLVVLVAVIVIKGVLFAVAKSVAKSEQSGAIEVDAGHHVADAITSAAAFIGISIALFGSWMFPTLGWHWENADDWAALFASVIIMFNAYLLTRVPMRELMDAAAPEDELLVFEPARRIARGVSGVADIEKIFARKAGGKYWLDMHLQVDGQMPVAEAHVVGGKVRKAIRDGLPNVRDVLVHLEPKG